ncbi:hypothetical protein [Robertmurraya korlensis]|uniref:hypothetical protein n=1 Tax=Robertmurraya korlensis TaxID=519977 RepID=UPI000824E7DC|nr:hypothetical protein [Robertmurraya korlensis]
MKSQVLLLLSIIVLVLTGCMYPQEELAQNQTPYEDQVQVVQSAVKQFQEDNGGILPIKTKDIDTAIYEKYPIDFNRISPKYLAEPPGNAYESGGVFQYVLVDVEENPTVKIFDLRIAEKIKDINLLISLQKYPPYKEELTKGVYTMDFKKIGYEDEPFVVSPYTGQNLSFVITGSGEVFVDYRSDLYQAMKNGSCKKAAGEDIRDCLLKDSLFVPAFSLPYTIDEKTKEPIFLAK